MQANFVRRLLRLAPSKPQTEVEREAAFWANRLRLLNAHAQRMADYSDTHQIKWGDPSKDFSQLSPEDLPSYHDGPSGRHP